MVTQNIINHVNLVIDRSSSMTYHRQKVVQVVDELVKHLAGRSTALDQETRISVYTFADKVECVIYDKDVLRLPSIAKFYQPYGMTALIDATIKSQNDLGLIPELYGDHAFLTYVVTDGQENASRKHGVYDVSRYLNDLKENWTVAVLVPDQSAKFEAKKFGFPADNIAIWDTTSTRGMEEAGSKIRQATDTFMDNRAKGVRGTKTLFSTGADAVNTKTVKQNLKFLPKDTYQIFDVKADGPVRPFVEALIRPNHYRIGGAYYQLTKTETIQPQKQIAVRDKRNGNIYSGQNARDLVGLGSDEVRVKPTDNPNYDVFVQSTSVNRKLIKGTKLLYFPQTVSV